MQVLAHMTGMGLQARRRRIQQLGDDICLGWLEPQHSRCREDVMQHCKTKISSIEIAELAHPREAATLSDDLAVRVPIGTCIYRDT